MNDINISNRLSLKDSILHEPNRKKDLSFPDRLKSAVEEVNKKHHSADQAMA